ncbi:hypothetical protein RAMDARK_1614 [Rickettsia amblyommatis str. Darkwater]|nr:hypothetical protein RAMDARK_1614 [Rickettsia amblyommatis str. Darkwater]
MKINIKKQQMSYRGLTTVSIKAIQNTNNFTRYRGQATV